MCRSYLSLTIIFYDHIVVYNGFHAAHVISPLL